MNNALPGSLKALLQEPTLQEKLHDLQKAIKDIPPTAPEFSAVALEIMDTLKKIAAVKAPDRLILDQFLLPPKPDQDELDRQVREFDAAWHQFVGPPKAYYQMNMPSQRLTFYLELPKFFSEMTRMSFHIGYKNPE